MKNEKDSSDGPTSVVFKKYGGNIYTQQAKEMGFKINSQLVQSLIFYEQAKRGWGPKLYGLFEGGRIEEFIDCHTLKAEEAFDPELSKDLAKAYARFHSLQVPIKKEHFDMLAQLLPAVDENNKQLATFIESKNMDETDPLMCFKRLHKFPFHEEGKWLESIRQKVTQRTVLCTMDPNYLNRLVRNERPSDPKATRTLIIDFDVSAYSYRGYDLGGHFILRMFNSDEEFKMSNLPYPSEAEQMTFLSAYLEEVEKLLDDLDKNSLDSVENLLLECQLNSLDYVVSILISGLKVHTILEEKPNLPGFIDPLLNVYTELKERFCSKYPELVKN